MPETLLPNVLIALAVALGGAGLTWLTALVSVKVFRWPSEKTVRRWDRLLKQNRGYADPKFWCWVIGLFGPFFLGVGLVLGLNAPKASFPNYAGRVVAVHECDRGPLTLWWLYRCEVDVRFDPEPVKHKVDLPEAPAHPVALNLDARRPLEIGDPVTWRISTSVREGTTTWTYALPFERDRPKLWPGALAGMIPAFAGSWLAGRWWIRSRPRHGIDEVSIRQLRREIRELKRDRDGPPEGESAQS